MLCDLDMFLNLQHFVLSRKRLQLLIFILALVELGLVVVLHLVDQAHLHIQLRQLFLSLEDLVPGFRALLVQVVELKVVEGEFGRYDFVLIQGEGYFIGRLKP